MKAGLWCAALLSAWLAACSPIEVGIVVTPTATSTARVEPVIQIAATRTAIVTVTSSGTPTGTFAPPTTPTPSDTPIPPTNTRRPIPRTATPSETPSTTPTPSVSPTVTLTPTPCAHTWFFSAPVPKRCPESAAVTAYAAAQRFERGRMLWLQMLDRYLVLVGAASGSLLTVDGPLPGDPTPIGTPPPPAGLFEPVSGFGILWRSGSTGVPAQRDVLGWATEPEFGYQAMLQCEVKVEDTQHCFIRLPEGPVVEHFRNNWRQW